MIAMVRMSGRPSWIEPNALSVYVRAPVPCVVQMCPCLQGFYRSVEWENLSVMGQRGSVTPLTRRKTGVTMLKMADVGDCNTATAAHSRGIKSRRSETFGGSRCL